MHAVLYTRFICTRRYIIKNRFMDKRFIPYRRDNYFSKSKHCQIKILNTIGNIIIIFLNKNNVAGFVLLLIFSSWWNQSVCEDLLLVLLWNTEIVIIFLLFTCVCCYFPVGFWVLDTRGEQYRVQHRNVHYSHNVFLPLTIISIPGW